MGRWAAGGNDNESKGEEERTAEEREAVAGKWRKSVIWYLRMKLGETGEMQRAMMERRMEREVERGRSVLYLAKEAMMEDKSRGELNGAAATTTAKSKGTSNARVPDEDMGSRDIERQLSPEQLQIFAQENNELLRHYEDTLDQVR